MTFGRTSSRCMTRRLLSANPQALPVAMRRLVTVAGRNWSTSIIIYPRRCVYVFIHMCTIYIYICIYIYIYTNGLYTLYPSFSPEGSSWLVGGETFAARTNMIFQLQWSYPSSHYHGSGKWPPWRLKSSSRPPFSTSMIMGERVSRKLKEEFQHLLLTLKEYAASFVTVMILSNFGVKHFRKSQVHLKKVGKKYLLKNGKVKVHKSMNTQGTFKKLNQPHPTMTSNARTTAHLVHLH